MITQPAIRKQSLANELEQPKLHFSLVPGVANRSKASWCKLSFRGHGPLSRRFNNSFGISSLFSSWQRYLISLDGDGLHIYSFKHSVESVHSVRLFDIHSIFEEIGASTKLDKNLGEDVKNVVVCVGVDGEDHMLCRFQDLSTRMHWMAVLNNAIGTRSTALRSVKKNVLMFKQLLEVGGFQSPPRKESLTPTTSEGAPASSNTSAKMRRTVQGSGTVGHGGKVSLPGAEYLKYQG